MTLSNGRPYVAIPGPSVMPDRVLAAMQRPAPNIYRGAIVDLTHSILADLKRVAKCTAHVALYICNGHGAWEASLCNMASRGDRMLACANGHFGLGWADAARRMGIDVETLDFGRSAPIDTDRLSETLKADRDHEIKAVLVTHVDTASSVRNDIQAVRAAIDAAGHPALLAVDAIASLGCDPLHFDDWGIDVLVAASQKGLMTPPGLGFLWFSDKALEQSRSADLATPYWSWIPRIEARVFSHTFGGTSPTHHLFALREALDMIEEEGLEHIWARHRALAGAVWAAFDVWGQDGPISLNVADPAMRSRAVTAARIRNGGGEALRGWVETQAGVTLGIGLGMALADDPTHDDFFRVGHMGHVNAHMTLGVLATMEAGLQALQIPHGSGALDAAAGAIVRAIPEIGAPAPVSA
ncbi:pyridoxal-phosphate-dependent aminotransferase family protein [Amorphus orientalis]|uniref:Alanine-glyoxylate transaminase/serine-glyoxylate transaminase/serine-pyruvate transaminase n=1 Tax=Amorphus orientalis TaxID=649198 RepID=A0AAE3VNR4_9HYPH|nr:aminotransferase class V-fold PLP-dependent enzyme [Amorphus orientalis]MDQ0315335.1 alanine-glyoxylate transaminase/serine-glyoxylate transaminase/serine-pyruvate transaminase [Amorphus orientalis]